MKYVRYTIAGAALVTAVYLTTSNEKADMGTPLSPTQGASSRMPTGTPAVASAVAPASQQQASPAGSAQSESLIASRLKGFKDCAEQEDCSYPQTDPQSYEFALHHDVANFLKQIPTTEIKDSPAAREELLDWMKRGNGFVQAQTLRHLHFLPPSSEVLDAIIEGVENNYHDALIVKQAMQEFSRYPDSPAVASFVQSTLAEGPQLSAVEAAKGIRNILTPKNVDNYERLLPQIRSESVREALSASLKDYRYSLAGG